MNWANNTTDGPIFTYVIVFEHMQVILYAAKTNIPNGSVKKFRPYWTKDLEKTVLERRRAREKAKKEPTAANRNNYNTYCQG